MKFEWDRVLLVSRAKLLTYFSRGNKKEINGEQYLFVRDAALPWLALCRICLVIHNGYWVLILFCSNGVYRQVIQRLLGVNSFLQQWCVFSGSMKACVTET